jgi:GNAT superfamily N-acetyltransferase
VLWHPVDFDPTPRAAASLRAPRCGARMTGDHHMCINLARAGGVNYDARSLQPNPKPVVAPEGTQGDDTGRPEVSIRAAGRDDVAVVLDLIRALADYEGLSHEVVADEASLATALFGERPVAEALIAECDGQPVGFAVFFHDFSTFLARPGIWLEDLFVRPQWRGRGIGRALLAFVARLAVERGCERLEWAVLDWNAPAIGFYRSLGADPLDDWTTFRVTGEQLRALGGGPS